MREKKYQNILNDYEEDKIGEEEKRVYQEKETEHQLSLTREMKYKDLHDKLKEEESKTNNDSILNWSGHDTSFDETSLTKEMMFKKNMARKDSKLNEEAKLGNADNLNNKVVLNNKEKLREEKLRDEGEFAPATRLSNAIELSSKDENKDNQEGQSKIKEGNIGNDFLNDKLAETNKENEKESAEGNKKESDEDFKELEDFMNTKEEDLFLTNSLKPVRKKFRLKKVFRVLLKLILFIVISYLIIHFVLLPLYHKYKNSQPKMIFDTAVDKISTTLIDTLAEDMENENSLYTDINFKVDTNIESMTALNGKNLGYRLGLDTKEQKYEIFPYLKDNDDIYGIHMLRYKDKTYYQYSNSTTYYDMTDMKIDNKEIEPINYDKILKQNKLDIKKITYIIEQEQEIIKELLESDLITAKKDELSVNGHNIKVVRNSYKLDSQNAQRIYKKYLDLISKDDKLINVLKEEEMTKEEYLDQLEEKLLKDISADYELIINLYTVKGTKVIGFDVEKNGFRALYYYSNEGNFEFYANMTKDETCLDSKDCLKDDDNKNIYMVTGVLKDDKTEVSIKYNGTLIAKLDVDTFNEEKIALSYEIYQDSNTYLGAVLLTKDNQEITGKIKLKDDDIYCNLEVMANSNKQEFGNILAVEVVPYTEKNVKEDRDLFFQELEDKNLAELYKEWYLAMNKSLFGDE